VNADDLKHPSDCWVDDEELPPSPADQEARKYIEINRRMAERFPEAYAKLRLPSEAQREPEY
jgi:hypothetical protein